MGMKKLFKQFSFPGGIPSHVAPETPGSIHEGGELGYSLAQAFGAVLDNPNLIAAYKVYNLVHKRSYLILHQSFGGYLRKDLIMPDFSNYEVDIPYPGSVKKQDMLVLRTFYYFTINFFRSSPTFWRS